MARLASVLAALALLCACTSVWAIRGFQIKVEPKAEDCFYRDFEAGTKVDFEWHVIDGGLLDVDIRVRTLTCPCLAAPAWPLLHFGPIELLVIGKIVDSLR